jgi:hypothetical protein
MNEIDFIFFLDFDKQNRLRIKFYKEKGDVVTLLVQYEALLENVWTAIVRYDTAHGFLHRDELFPDGSQRKTPIDMDLNAGLTFAQFDLKDRWEFFRDRFIRLMKK